MPLYPNVGDGIALGVVSQAPVYTYTGNGFFQSATDNNVYASTAAQPPTWVATSAAIDWDGRDVTINFNDAERRAELQQRLNTSIAEAEERLALARQQAHLALDGTYPEEQLRDIETVRYHLRDRVVVHDPRDGISLLSAEHPTDPTPDQTP